MRFNFVTSIVIVGLTCMMLTSQAACDRRSPAEPASGEGQAVIIPDTPELWREFVIATDWSISDEKAGEPPGGGRQSWTESWTRKLRGLRKGSQENPEKYVEYIIEARSAAGLPDLPKGTTAEPASGEGQAVIIPDTPELWYEFVVVTDGYVSDEKNGLAPPGGVQSWAKHWTDVLRHIAKARENPEKYVEYIIEARSAAGLPDLPNE